MKGLFKWLIGIAVSLLVLVAAAAVIVPMVVDPNDYKPQIEQAAKDQTGRDLRITGDIGISVFPWLALDLGATELGNAQGFGDQPMAELAETRVSIKLMPLLSKKIEIGDVLVSGLRLRLATNAQGVNNWDDLTQTETTEPAPQDSAPAETAENTEPGFEINELKIDGLRVTDAQVSYLDQQTGQQVALNKLELGTGSLALGKPVKLSMQAEGTVSEPEIRAKADLKATIAADMSSKQYTLSDMVLQLDAGGEGIGADIVALIKANVNADMNAEIISAEGLSFTLDAKTDAVPKGEVGVSLTGEAQANLKDQTAKISELLLKVANIEVKGQASATQIMDNPNLTGRLDLKEFNLRETLDSLGIEVPETADPEVLKNVGGKILLVANKNSAKVSELQFRLDESTLNGSASVKNFSAPEMAFDLAIDKLDADRYLAPTSETADDKSSAKESTASTEDTNNTPVDLSFLETLNASGKAKLGWLKVSNVEMTDATVGLQATSGKATIPMAVSLYEGKLDGKFVLTAQNGKQNVVVQQKLTGLEVEPLTVALMGEPKVAGKGDVSIDVQTSGNTVGALRQQLNGNLNFALENGAVHGFNLAQMIRKAKAQLSGDVAALQAAAETQQTDFSKLTGSATIVNGVLSSDDLSGSSPALRLGGEGKVDLYKETLNYIAQVSIVETSKGQGGDDLNELNGLTIPVQVRNTWADPKVKIPLDDVIKERAKQKFNEKKDAEVERAREKVKEKFNEKLHGLFK